MSKKLAKAIKDARTGAGLTQQGLADKVPGLTASDISKAERNEKDLTQDQLKAIAKATGVTQKSLLEAAGSSSKPSSSSGKTASSSGSSMKITAAEKKLVELYRAADSETKKAAVKVLKGENSSDFGDLFNNLLGSAVSSFLKKDNT